MSASRVTRRVKKLPNYSKSGQEKKTKHLHQTTFEKLKAKHVLKVLM
jgi:hypothetical protein